MAIAPSLSRAIFFCEQFIYERREFVVVKTFAERFVKFHAEPRINFVELLLRQRNHLTPNLKISWVSALKFYK